MVPVMVRAELWAVAVGHSLSTADALALTHEEAMVHVPTIDPPQAAVLPHVPPELPHPVAASAPINPKTDANLIIVMRR